MVGGTASKHKPYLSDAAVSCSDHCCCSCQVVLRNGCLPATPSALMDMCLEQSVDEDVDLLFIEYVANDGANR